MMIFVVSLPWSREYKVEEGWVLSTYLPIGPAPGLGRHSRKALGPAKAGGIRNE